MSRRLREAGQSAVEFALVLPILLLLLIGVFDFGRAFYYYNAVANAAREGARAGVYTSASDASIRAAVHQYGVGLVGLTDSNIVILPVGARFSGEAIQVTVSYRFDAVTPLVDAFLPGGTITLISSSTMHVE